MKMTDASALDDATLTADLARMAAGERQATAALVRHLAEFDARRLYEPAGFSSLFRYCQAVLHLSEDAIYNRIETARAARCFPGVLEMLIAGKLGVTTARMLARHLTDENHQALLTEASGKGKRDVEELLARHPQPHWPPPFGDSRPFARSCRTATRSASRPPLRCATSCAPRRTCWVTPFPAATSPRSSIGR